MADKVLLQCWEHDKSWATISPDVITIIVRSLVTKLYTTETHFLTEPRITASTKLLHTILRFNTVCFKLQTRTRSFQ